MKKFFLFLLVLILFYPTNVFALENFSLSDISSGDFFGHDIESIGDIDGDGISDIAVGAPYDDDGGPSHGAVYILFLNSDGTVKDSQKISSTEGNFQGVIDSGDCWGNAITSLNDFDGDGITDIAVGAHKNYSPGTEMKRVGAVHILLLNSDGTVKSSQEISDTQGNFDALNENDIFGIDLVNLSDINNDGITDIAVGAHGDSENGFSRGAVYILFLNSDGTVNFYEKINSKQNNFKFQLNDSDMFGTSVSNIGDINNDGITDIAVGSPHRHYFDAELSPIHILLLEKDGKVKYSETIPSENDTKINPEIYYFLGIPLIFVIFLVIIVKIKLRNSNQK